MAMIEDGQAVSVCASSRITDAAHEAGVETLPEHRRKGHAVNVVAGWASAVRLLGADPFYSTSWENVASQNVATRLGLSAFGVDFHIT
ncbi:MAG: GNAT family N-acetyltransferase [Gammaproteobacteria bacterium]|nr:MAG: GNAT family N-acetyltransferase [Gammaproteobacteria bacterium]